MFSFPLKLTLTLRESCGAYAAGSHVIVSKVRVSNYGSIEFKLFEPKRLFVGDSGWWPAFYFKGYSRTRRR
jgi:hypothetical protein